jgi:hypothetical protein
MGWDADERKRYRQYIGLYTRGPDSLLGPRSKPAAALDQQNAKIARRNDRPHTLQRITKRPMRVGLNILTIS